MFTALRQSRPGRWGQCLASAPLIKPNHFVSRAVELDAMNNILQRYEASVEQRRLVVGRVGGIRKTQLAIAYAQRHQRSYTSVLWLNATSEVALYDYLHQWLKDL